MGGRRYASTHLKLRPAAPSHQVVTGLCRYHRLLNILSDVLQMSADLWWTTLDLSAHCPPVIPAGIDVLLQMFPLTAGEKLITVALTAPLRLSHQNISEDGSCESHFTQASCICERLWNTQTSLVSDVSSCSSARSHLPNALACVRLMQGGQQRLPAHCLYVSCSGMLI